MTGLRPIPDDPGGPLIESMFDLRSEEWLVMAKGTYQTGAVEAFRDDGSGFVRVVVLEWPARVNHSTELRTVRLMMSAVDAAGLAKMLHHTAAFLERLP